MTDIECSKICEVLDASKLFINTDGVVCVLFNDASLGHLYIYEGSFSSALPFRILRHKQKELSTKEALELMLKQAEDGISTMVVMPAKSGKLNKQKFIDKDDTVESFLVKYDLMHLHKRHKRRKSQ